MSNLDNTYFLQSARLGFRLWAEDDKALALGLWGDPDVTRLIGGPFSDAQVLARLAHEIALHCEHGVQYWPAFLLTTGEHIGCCGLRPYRIEANVYEFGIHLNKAYWGQGFGQEAANAAIDHAFNAIGVTALCAGHHPNNTASRRLLLRLGFAYTHDEYYAPTGLQHPSYLLKSPHSMP